MIDLQGLTVLVTRPDPKGSELAVLIQTHDGNAIHLPTIEFAPPPDLAAFHAGISALDKMDWLIFNSPQAVYASIPAIRHTWPHFNERVKFAAIGEGTASALEEAGYRIDLYPDKEWNSKGLLALPAFQAVHGKKIAIIRGLGGQELLDQILKERDAQILTIIAYQRILANVDTSEAQNLIKQKKIGAVVASSCEGLSNLRILLGQTSFSAIQALPLVVLSERIKRLAEDLGFQTIWVTRQAANAAIVETLASIGKQHERSNST